MPPSPLSFVEYSNIKLFTQRAIKPKVATILFSFQFYISNFFVGKLHRTLHLWKKEYLLKISSKEKWTKATEHWKKCVLKNAFGVFKKYRFLGYRKQVE
jgi:hypothetical protein